MKSYFWPAVGLALLSVTLGLLVGSSESPLTGAVITSLFALVTGLLGVVELRKEKNLTTLMIRGGQTLSLFSITFLTGVYGGIQYRNFEPYRSFKPWSDTPPATVYEAIDWLEISEYLKQKGYSENIIVELYHIRLKEKLDTTNVNYLGDSYDNKLPYFQFLTKGREVKKVNRGPASED